MTFDLIFLIDFRTFCWSSKGLNLPWHPGLKTGGFFDMTSQGLGYKVFEWFLCAKNTSSTNNLDLDT